MASGDRSAIPAMAAGFIAMDQYISKGTGDTLNLPDGMANIGGNGKGYLLASQTDWDPTANSDGTFSSLGLGDDIYVYAVQDPSGVAAWVASQNATVPDGYTADTSRKIGGFHYGRVRPVSEAFNAGAALSQQIVPNSCWDLQHRPKCDPTGMVEVIDGALWADIYLASEDGAAWPETVPLSEYNAVPLTGTEGYAHYDYTRLARNAGKRLPTYSEWLAAAYGTPKGATGAGGRVNTGQHGDYGFECVSCLNVDQPSGNIYQVGSEHYDRSTGTGWKDDLNAGKDSGSDHGQWYGGDLCQSLFGGNWDNGAVAGARAVNLHNAPWHVHSYTGLRAVCDSL